jgi:hypothetical protein
MNYLTQRYKKCSESKLNSDFVLPYNIESVRVKNNIYNSDFIELQKILCSLFNNCGLFENGENDIFLVGGLNRDSIANNPREPQDFDLYYINNSYDYNSFYLFCDFIKKHSFDILDVKIRNLRKSKSINLKFRNKYYSIDMHPVLDNKDLILNIATKTNFTMNCFYRHFSEVEEYINIFDVSGSGVKDINDRIIRFTPLHNFNNSDFTNEQNIVSAFLCLLKMANIAYIENNNINNIFIFEEKLQKKALEAIDNKFLSIPDWRIKYTIEKEIPNEILLIKNKYIKEYFYNLIYNSDFYMCLLSRSNNIM